jgi:hypothetical protein
MEYRIVYRDLNTGQLVDIQCNDETYYRLIKAQNAGEIVITYDERKENYYEQS